MATGTQGGSCCGHLGRYSPFALEFGLVALKGLLPAVLELVAVVVLWETVLSEERMSYTITKEPIANGLYRKIRIDSGGIDPRCGERQSCRVFRPGAGNVSWGPWCSCESDQDGGDEQGKRLTCEGGWWWGR